MNRDIDFPLEKGLKIQAEQLAEWKVKLTPNLYEDLVVYASTDKENWSDGFDVKRGSTLSQFIANWNGKPNFNLMDELEALSKELDMQEINGLIFVGALANDGAWHLSFNPNLPSIQDVNIFCTPFQGVDGIQFSIGDKKVFVPCERPTSYEEFDEWKKFYLGQLHVVQGKFATVETIKVDNNNKVYSVEGFLVPKQSIRFDDYSDWNSIIGHCGNPILDCQLDLDEGLQFQYTDYNFVIDAEEGESEINLDDTQCFGSDDIFVCREYRSCLEIDLVSEPHELTKRILDQFYVKYNGHNEDGDTETIILLDEMVKRYLK